MQFDFDRARVSAEGELCLAVKNLPMARKFVLGMRERMYTCEVREYRKKRSLDANAYFWVLCDKLAEATNQPKEAVYRESIRNIGGNSTIVRVSTVAADKLRENWHKNGLGWVSDELPCRFLGYTNVVLYYGSSTYDTAQMSRLIDNIVQDCRAVGIETLPPEKLEALKDAWAR